MSEVENLSIPPAPTPEDEAYRQQVMRDLIAATGNKAACIRDGRASFRVPLETYLAHVDVSSLERALFEARRCAWVAARAVARLERGEFFRFCLGGIAKEPIEFDEDDAVGALGGDGMEGALDDVPAQPPGEALAVNVGLPDCAGEAHDHLMQRVDEGNHLVPVSEIHSEPPVPVRATPPP